MMSMIFFVTKSGYITMKNITKHFVRGNLIFLFVVAFMAGVIAKKAMFNEVRIGFNDPQTVIHIGSLYDLDHAEQEVIKKGVPQQNEVDQTNGAN